MRDRCPTCGRTKPPPKKRRKHVNPRNRERKAKRMEEQFGDQARMCRLVPCCLPRCAGRAEPAHVRSRGAGGKDSDTVPLCRKHHREQHETGIDTFQKKHGISLDAVAGRMGELAKAHACADWVKDKTCQVCLAEVEGEI